MSAATDTKAVLVKARQILTEPRRWIKGKAREKINGDFGYCSIGAIHAAAGFWTQQNLTTGMGPVTPADDRVFTAYNRDAQIKATALLNNVLVTNFKNRNGIAWWNDSDATHPQVLAAFDKAIEQARAEVAKEASRA